MSSLPSSPANERPGAPFAAPSLARQWLLGVSLILIAFNLRPVFGSISVLLPEVMRDTGMGPSAASLLTTLPLLCLGVFAIPAPALARRFGPERVLLGALLLICVGTLLRGTGHLPVLFASTAMAGAGIAVGNVLLPGLVKRDFPTRASMMTGLYTLSVCAGASSSTAFTVPLERHFFHGEWALTLASWALPAALVLMLWAPQAFAAKPIPAHAQQRSGSLWRDPLAWQVMGFMGLQSALAYIVLGWLAPLLRERGLDGAQAGYVVAVSILVQLMTCLVTPSIAARCRDQRAFGVTLAVVVCVAMLALIFGPLSGRWVWAVLLGCGQGGAFALALTLIVLRSPDPGTTAQLSAMAQGGGYILASGGPLLAGLLRGWTGSFESSAALLVILSLAMAACGWGAGRRLLVQGAAKPASGTPTRAAV
ncbi:MFS transporter [Variovorax dokdonensis]|uniref:MFS transporter n=1 Tax=Variovorax dokdonensis TaxID=344883 RepID=A0ABT7N5F2_9BURK|nr:MFS transporter [Variovorax dokdonensis]MDM0043150.1 MFS transporter [Variovorax dokdonensis]